MSCSAEDVQRSTNSRKRSFQNILSPGPHNIPDEEIEHPPKRRKCNFTSILPPELHNLLYKEIIAQKFTEKETYAFRTITEEGIIPELDIVHEFFCDDVSPDGGCKVLDDGIAKVIELTEDYLSFVTHDVIFQITTASCLRKFAKKFNALQRVCSRNTELHVLLDLIEPDGLSEVYSIDDWFDIDHPHGREVDVEEQIKGWFEAIQLLPKTTHIHLNFYSFWRDFRTLRSLAKSHGIGEYPVYFMFDEAGYPHTPEYLREFLAAQTMAAIMGIELPEKYDMHIDMRIMLVEHGCTGFSVRRRPIATGATG